MKFVKGLGVAAIMGVFALGGAAHGQEFADGHQLFSNQYTQGMANQATAQMYVAPVPVPAWVGHTYYTYQPLYPHELMYGHKHRYHNYYDMGRGLNRTTVRYSTAPLHSAVSNIFNSIALPRRY